MFFETFSNWSDINTLESIHIILLFKAFIIEDLKKIIPIAAHDWPSRPLVQQTIGAANHWCSRPLVQQTTDAADHWCSRPLVHQTISAADHWSVTDH